jgi:hypothetical protein
MQPSQAEKWITDARFAPYLAHAGGDHAVAVALYVWNARISAAMFETLHHVEVLLRNAVDERFMPINPSAGAGATWLTDPAILNEASRQRVAETIERVRREGKSPTRGRVVAGLSFAFWRALFDRKYDWLWVAQLHRGVPGRLRAADRGCQADVKPCPVPQSARASRDDLSSLDRLALRGDADACSIDRS